MILFIVTPVRPPVRPPVRTTTRVLPGGIMVIARVPGTDRIPTMGVVPKFQRCILYGTPSRWFPFLYLVPDKLQEFFKFTPVKPYSTALRAGVQLNTRSLDNQHAHGTIGTHQKWHKQSPHGKIGYLHPLISEEGGVREKKDDAVWAKSQRQNCARSPQRPRILTRIDKSCSVALAWLKDKVRQPLYPKRSDTVLTCFILILGKAIKNRG